MIPTFMALHGTPTQKSPSDGLATPTPEYVPDTAPYNRPPATIGADLNTRALTAMHQAKKHYPGVVGEVLAAEIDAFRELGWWADLNSPIARLIRELTPH